MSGVRRAPRGQAISWTNPRTDRPQWTVRNSSRLTFELSRPWCLTPLSTGFASRLISRRQGATAEQPALGRRPDSLRFKSAVLDWPLWYLAALRWFQPSAVRSCRLSRLLERVEAGNSRREEPDLHRIAVLTHERTQRDSAAPAATSFGPHCPRARKAASATLRSRCGSTSSTWSTRDAESAPHNPVGCRPAVGASVCPPARVIALSAGCARSRTPPHAVYRLRWCGYCQCL